MENNTTNITPSVEQLPTLAPTPKLTAPPNEGVSGKFVAIFLGIIILITVIVVGLAFAAYSSSTDSAALISPQATSSNQ